MKIRWHRRPGWAAEIRFGRNNQVKTMKYKYAIVGMLLAGSGAFGQDGSTDGESRVKISGFVSAVGGAVLNGSLHGKLPYQSSVNCPCYLSNWSYNGWYDENFSFNADSRAGLQANIKLTDKLDFVTQIVTRGKETDPAIQWAYLSYKVTDGLEIQAGRKRVPLYFYSEFQDVGLAIPWVAPPTELYGWEINNYNGAAVRYRTSFGDLNMTGTVFYGNETVSKSKYNQAFTGFGPGWDNSDVSWKNIFGGDLEFNKDWWTFRAIMLQSNNETVDRAGPVMSTSDMKVYGLAFNGDFDNWFFLSELTRNDRTYTGGTVSGAPPSFTVQAPAFLVGAGYRVGKWTPFFSVSRYLESTTPQARAVALYSEQGWIAYNAVLRYDPTSSSSIKAQLTRNLDLSPKNDFSGDATVLRISYDWVF